MRIRLLRAAWLVAIAGSLGLPLAHADVYTWVDASGKVNISNLDPPPGARITNVVHLNPPKAPVVNEAAREAERQADMQALADRVAQLQDQVDNARRQPPAVEYRVVAAPPPPSYVNDYAGPPPDYAPQADYAYAGGCNPSWYGCAYGWGYPASFVVVRPPNGHRFNPGRGGRHMGPPPPMHAPGGMRKR